MASSPGHELYTDLPSNVTDIAARLNGHYLTDGLTNTFVRFYWGTTSEVLGDTPQVPITTVESSYYADISGLTPGVTYYFQAVLDWPDGGLVDIVRSFVAQNNVIDRLNTVRDIVTMEGIRQLEMDGIGRFHVDRAGNAVYRSRFWRAG